LIGWFDKTAAVALDAFQRILTEHFFAGKACDLSRRVLCFGHPIKSVYEHTSTLAERSSYTLVVFVVTICNILFSIKKSLTFEANELLFVTRELVLSIRPGKVHLIWVFFWSLFVTRQSEEV